MLALLVLSFISGCTSLATREREIPDNKLFISDHHNIGVVDLEQKTTRIIKNKRFLQSIYFNKYDENLIGPTYSPENRFLGLTILNSKTNNLNRIDLDKFAPVHVYAYKDQLVMDSAQVIADQNMTVQTEIGIYNLGKREFAKKLRVYGIVQSITGKGDLAFISSREADKGLSNIYLVNLKDLTMDKLFISSGNSIPTYLTSYNEQIYAIYSGNWGQLGLETKNQLVKVNLQKQEIASIAMLDNYVNQLAVFNDKAYVIHYDTNNGIIELKTDISIVDLKSGKVKTLDIKGRMSSISIYQGNIIVGNSSNSELILLDPRTDQILNNVKVDIEPLEMASSEA